MNYEERQKAAERIGDTSDKVLRWLLRFNNTDLSKLTEGQWLDLERECYVFLTDGPPASHKRSTTWPDRGWRLPISPHPRAKSRVPGMSRRTVQDFQESLRTWLERLMQTYRLDFPPMPITLLIFHPKRFLSGIADSQLPVNGFYFPYFEDYHQVFAYHVAHILGDHSGRLRRCTECETIFLMDRRQQVFCAPRCLNRVTQRRWRA